MGRSLSLKARTSHVLPCPNWDEMWRPACGGPFVTANRLFGPQFPGTGNRCDDYTAAGALHSKSTPLGTTTAKAPKNGSPHGWLIDNSVKLPSFMGWTLTTPTDIWIAHQMRVHDSLTHQKHLWNQGRNRFPSISSSSFCSSSFLLISRDFR